MDKEITEQATNIARFSLYCAKIMGYDNVYWSYAYDSLMMEGLPHARLEGFNQPYTDLNAMAKVVDKLSKQWKETDKIFYAWCICRDSIEVDGVKKSFQAFIIATMGNED